MAKDPLALRRIDHVRFFVGNARQSAYFYRNAFGFEVLGYAGLETGVKDEAGYVLRQGQITFVLTSPLTTNHPDSYRLQKHGDGVLDIAFDVEDVPGGGFTKKPLQGARAVGVSRRLRSSTRTPTASLKSRPSAPTPTPTTVSSTAIAIVASSPPVTSRSTPIVTAPSPFTPRASSPSTTSSATSRKAR